MGHPIKGADSGVSENGVFMLRALEISPVLFVAFCSKVGDDDGVIYLVLVGLVCGCGLRRGVIIGADRGAG